MDAEVRRRLEASGYARPGFAERYEACRPRPPSALLELLPPLVRTERLRLVVDLGSGTGLSTRIWASQADEVVGVEPNEAMLTHAAALSPEENVRYVHGAAYDTGLPAESADIVTASQSFHWMRPERVFPELARILRPGGVFCAYEYFALQTPLWEPEAAFSAVRTRMQAAREARGLAADIEIWPLSRERLEESGIFRNVRELALHSVEEGDGDRLVGFSLSEGSLLTALEAGVTEEEVGLDRLRDAVARIRDPIRWWISYCVWLGLK